jgi:hypothetical protein
MFLSPFMFLSPKGAEEHERQRLEEGDKTLKMP